MIATKAPIGEIINYIHKNPNSLKENFLLQSQIEDLIDLIIIRTERYGITQAFDTLQDDLFKLRFELIKETDIVNSVFGKLKTVIDKRIKKQFDSKTDYKDLELAFVNALNIYGQIAESIIKKIQKEPVFAISDLTSKSFEYGSLVSFLKSLPGKESSYYISYISSSIVLDYSFIISELLFNKELSLKKAEIIKLTELLKNSTEDFAVFSNLFNLWSPNDNDESQWIRNIKIRISLNEAKMMENKKFSSKDLDKILAA